MRVPSYLLVGGASFFFGCAISQVPRVKVLPEGSAIVKVDANRGQDVQIMKIDGLKPADYKIDQLTPGRHNILVLGDVITHTYGGVAMTATPMVYNRNETESYSEVIELNAQEGHIYSVREGCPGETEVFKVSDITPVVRHAIERANVSDKKAGTAVLMELQGLSAHAPKPEMIEIDGANPLDLGADYSRNSWDGTENVFLSPEEHVIALRCRAVFGKLKLKLYISEIASIKFTPEVGHTYKVMVNPDGEKLCCDLWIEDMNDHRLVGEKITKNLLLRNN